MTDLATLAIRVESVEAQVAQGRLDGLVRSGTSAEQQMGKLGSASGGMGSSLQQAHGHATNLAGSLAALVGVALTVGSAFAIIKSNIDAISERALGAIGTAAMMLSRANIEGIEDQRKAYGEYKGYVLSMYEALNAETERHFASGKEMIGTFEAFAKRGIYAAGEEANAIGVISDAIKLLHRGTMDESTALHEIMGLMEGHAGIRFKLAQQLEGMIGPKWKEIVQEQIKAGTFLTFLQEKYIGLAVAGGDIQKVLTAQRTTLDTLLSQVGKAGLAGMYEDIVGWVVEINKYLRIHKDELITKIAATWEGMQGTVYGVATGIGAITNALADFAGKVDEIGKNPAFMALFGAAAGFRILGLPGMVVGTGIGLGKGLTARDEAWIKQYNLLQSGAGPYGEAAESFFGPAPKTTPEPPPWTVRPPRKKDKGTESAEASVSRFIESMNQEIAKGAGDTEAILVAWKNKQLLTLEELAKKGVDIASAKVALAAAVDSKQRKLDSDFTDWYIAGMGNQYEALVKQENKKLTEVAKNTVKLGQVHEVYARKKSELDDQVQSNTMNLFKGYLDTMASLSPTLEGQLILKREALDLELKLAHAALEREIREKKIRPELVDQARGMEAVVAQAKRYNLEMESNKGFAGWAWSRAKEMDQRGGVKDIMGSLESGFQNAFSSGLQGVLAHDKNTLKKIGETMLHGFLGEITKANIANIFGQIAKLGRPETPGGMIAGGIGRFSPNQLANLQEEAANGSVEAAKQLTLSAQGLQGAGGGLTTASGGLSLSGASLGLSAVGLVASGIGILTGSQALVTVGLVLQTAAMLLTTAAIISMAKWWHAGGIVAHRGLVVAHAGLAYDERPAIVQVGEGILRRSAMAELERQWPGAFTQLNKGRLPVMAAPVSGGVTIHAPITFAPVYNYRPTQQDMNRDAKMMAKALKRELGNQLNG